MKTGAPREVLGVLCDLHLHTTKSDGVYTPDRLFEEIRSRKLKFFSVSDHDCMGAYPVPEDLREMVIPGMEVDSEHDGHTVHLLAYGIRTTGSPLLQALEAQRDDRLRRMLDMLDRLAKLGVHVSIDHVMAQASGATSLGRPHLARALVAAGHATSIQDAFDRYLADEGAAYAPLARLTSATIVERIHDSGGIAVVAHPARLRSSEHLEQLIALGVDGIEVIHPTASPEIETNLRKIARAHGLLVTGGTDFHAPDPERPIGVELHDTEIEALQNALQKAAA